MIKIKGRHVIYIPHKNDSSIKHQIIKVLEVKEKL